MYRLIRRAFAPRPSFKRDLPRLSIKYILRITGDEMTPLNSRTSQAWVEKLAVSKTGPIARGHRWGTKRQADMSDG